MAPPSSADSMLSPATYQGGKGRLAAELIERMALPPDALFYDLCCGSGAVSLAAVAAGHPPARIVMVDQGPWGLFWKAIGDGTFDLDLFKSYCDAIPEDPRKVKAFVQTLYEQPVGENRIYVHLLLQAAALGGKPVWIEGSAWRWSGARDFWLPTATSSRRSPVNPMMPMPQTIYARAARIVKGMQGVRGICGDATQVRIAPGSVVYIDPPYADTTGYGYSIDAVSVAKMAAACGAMVWVSEGKPLSECAWQVVGGRLKGGITGDRKKPAHVEWLSYFGSVCAICHAFVMSDGFVWIDSSGGDVCAAAGGNGPHFVVL